MIYYYTSEKLPDDLISQLVIYATAAFRLMPSLNLITTSNQKIKFGYPAAQLLSKANSLINEIKNKTKQLDKDEINFNSSLSLEKIS